MDDDVGVTSLFDRIKKLSKQNPSSKYKITKKINSTLYQAKKKKDGSAVMMK